jgi:hypothetical protein
MNELLGNYWFLLFASITIIAVASALAVAWLMVRKAEATTALKQAMLARGLSVDEMERLLRPASLTDERLVDGLAGRLGELSASGETIKTVLEAFQAADPSSKRLLYRAVLAVCAPGKPCDEQILGVVRGLIRADGAGEIGLNSGLKVTQQAPGICGKWDIQGIRVEQDAAADVGGRDA